MGIGTEVGAGAHTQTHRHTHVRTHTHIHTHTHTHTYAHTHTYTYTPLTGPTGFQVPLVGLDTAFEGLATAHAYRCSNKGWAIELSTEYKI